MKFFKKSKRHLSKHTKAKPTVRRSITRDKILVQKYECISGTMKRRELTVERRKDRVENLGSNLISAMEWRYMRKSLSESTKHLPKREQLEKQKEIAEIWAEGQRRVKGASL